MEAYIFCYDVFFRIIVFTSGYEGKRKSVHWLIDICHYVGAK